MSPFSVIQSSSSIMSSSRLSVVSINWLNCHFSSKPGNIKGRHKIFLLFFLNPWYKHTKMNMAYGLASQLSATNLNPINFHTDPAIRLDIHIAVNTPSQGSTITPAMRIGFVSFNFSVISISFSFLKNHLWINLTTYIITRYRKDLQKVEFCSIMNITEKYERRFLYETKKTKTKECK